MKKEREKDKTFSYKQFGKNCPLSGLSLTNLCFALARSLLHIKKNWMGNIIERYIQRKYKSETNVKLKYVQLWIVMIKIGGQD